MVSLCVRVKRYPRRASTCVLSLNKSICTINANTISHITTKQYTHRICNPRTRINSDYMAVFSKAIVIVDHFPVLSQMTTESEMRYIHAKWGKIFLRKLIFRDYVMLVLSWDLRCIIIHMCVLCAAGADGTVAWWGIRCLEGRQKIAYSSWVVPWVF